MFSKACEHAIKACIYIATKSFEGQRANIREIAGEIGSPIPFTAKILHQLVKNNIITSVKGPSGGFYFETDQIKKIKLRDIVFVMDGKQLYVSCVLGMKECSELHPCPVHNQYKIIKNGMREMLDTTDLKQLCTSLKSGDTFLKM